LSYTRAREIVRSALATLGVNNRKFGLHSFRSGGATAACKFGISDRLFKIHGRWKSENAKDGYVCEDLQFLKTSVYNDIRIKYTQLSLFISKWSLRQTISL
jgi:hypothetical protein